MPIVWQRIIPQAAADFRKVLELKPGDANAAVELKYAESKLPKAAASPTPVQLPPRIKRKPVHASVATPSPSPNE